MAFSPEQIGVVMADVGWVPPYGIQVHTDGTVTVIDKAAKRHAVAFFDTAIAVCLAESGGDPLNKNPNSSAKGLWQIMESVHGAMIKEEQKRWQAELQTPKTPNVFEPHVNTSVAMRLWQSRQWAPWEAYNNGTYKPFLGHGKQVFDYLTSPEMNADKLRALTEEYLLGKATFTTAAAGANPALAVASDLGIDDVVGRVLSFVKSAGLTIGGFVLGLILVILGAWFVLSQTKAGKAIKSVVPVGKVIP